MDVLDRDLLLAVAPCFFSASTWAAFALVSFVANVSRICFVSIDCPGNMARR
jgi:hypothetical protein